MQPFTPPPVAPFELWTALAWGLMLSAVPLACLLVAALMKRKKVVVTALGFTAITFAAGAFLISPIDAERQTTATRDRVVSEWLDENYPQYGGADVLLGYFNGGETFEAVADNGKYRTMHFSSSPEHGYRLVVLGEEETPIIPMGDRVDVAGQHAEKAAAQN